MADLATDLPEGHLRVKVPKGGGATLDVDVNALDKEVFAAIVEAGLEVFLAKRMSKITGLTKLEGDDLAKAHAAAIVIAQKNLDDLNSGKVPGKGKSARKSGVPAAVMTEARRLAKNVAKDAAREAGHKISHIEAAEWTRAANQMVADDPSYVEQAKINLEARSAVVSGKDNAVAFLSKFGGIKESPVLIAKAAEANAKKRKGDGTISAKQAGKVAPRKGSQPGQHA